ncbi:MAG: formylglycine-generating enzyme family protein [Oligosphaeraceae bacterium]
MTKRTSRSHHRLSSCWGSRLCLILCLWAELCVCVGGEGAAEAPYLVIDLSSGPSSGFYPYRSSETGPELSGERCRTEELWLRRVPAGRFQMGSAPDEPGRFVDEGRHEVSVGAGFLLGVFEVTRRQYELVMGTAPGEGEPALPVSGVPYVALRGMSAEGWPGDGHRVPQSSFFGRLQARTGLLLDLPTEAQWEYACRAGGSAEPPSAVPGLRRVGESEASAWGLHDLLGNVAEWCLDWYGPYPEGAVEDTGGPAAGLRRCVRGGHWRALDRADWRPAARDNALPDASLDTVGFRVACREEPVGAELGTLTVAVWPRGARWRVRGQGGVWRDGDSLSLTSGPYEVVAEGQDGYEAPAPRAVQVVAGQRTFASLSLVPCDYLVVDVSGGPDAPSYPVRHERRGPSVPSEGGACRAEEIWLRRVPAGETLLGSPGDELGRVADETPRRALVPEGLYVGVFEVTQRQYELVMGMRPSLLPGGSRPVEQVTLGESLAFARRLVRRTGLAFGLPTEAEWEHACRSGSAWALGDGSALEAVGESAALSRLGRYWHNGGETEGTAPVGAHQPNAWGLHDLHGNVWEWCVAADGGAPAALRGGAWDSEAHLCRAASRQSVSSRLRAANVGFRLVCRAAK